MALAATPPPSTQSTSSTPGASTTSLVETDDDADRISLAMNEAERDTKPVAVLVGTEFGA